MKIQDEERRYSLGEAPYILGSKDFTILHRRSFSKKRLERQDNMSVSLWNVSPPRWPGARKSKISPMEMESLLTAMHEHSQVSSHLVLWMPARELHRTMMDPIQDVGPWVPQATILSGSLRQMEIGYVYSKGRTGVKWGSLIVPDDQGRCGSASSHAMRFIVERLLINDTFYYDTRRIVEPFVHASGQLALWSRRMAVKYVGYTK